MAAEELPVPSTSTRRETQLLPSKGTSFLIPDKDKSFHKQYANIYFLRLNALRDSVLQNAERKWKHVEGDPIHVPRVLEVVKAKLCYVVGTVYMEMPLKPSVMEDIARDVRPLPFRPFRLLTAWYMIVTCQQHSIAPPPPPSKICSPDDSIMLEDESGRIRLVGARVKAAPLVTGVIIGVLGVETPNGDFEVVDICYAEMPPPTYPKEDEGAAMEVEEEDAYIAVVSGLDVGAPSAADAHLQLLVEYLTGEAGGLDDAVSASHISRLVIAGNSLSTVVVAEEVDDRKARKYGYDNTTFSPHPTLSLSAILVDIGRTMPIHLLPGASDPSGSIMPQQPLPRRMFGAVSKLSTFSCETNPTYVDLAFGSRKRQLLIHSGQPLDDMFKYLPSPARRLDLAEATLRWQHMAPTAPDTLWCHPFFHAEPFVLPNTPNLYIIGGQRKFATRMVGPDDRRCRIVLVPHFASTGTVVLVNMRTLDAKTVTLRTHRMAGGAHEDQAPTNGREPTPTPAEPDLTMSEPDLSQMEE
ncbi:DNA polymerase alpha/epsilon subunit B-domain-containing protein [Schizophyllum amplum]|uniref:DNA polymerase alpha/epsilon subunit B-domain-containing protein n=1 Tax=Schizophyllum amplum TaxID=97359 RepID=A0A550CA77_9AGAR|nr:DNA polymerase alpha/epsilon subunit B-domain-containing protein [Auriculariopsis ampla]